MPSITIADLNNAKSDVDHIAQIATSTANTATDRLGNVKKTVVGAIAAISGITNRGAWVAATAYAVKDIVLVAGTWYIAVVAHTSSAAFATDLANMWRVYQGVIAADLAAPSGASTIGFAAAGVGAAARDMQAKGRDTICVADYRQVGDTDDSLSYQRAVDALPATGGTILVPDKAYVLATAPAWGAKSVMWSIGAGATFSGAGTGLGLGKFPTMVTNTTQVAVGPFIQSQSTTPSPTGGGIAAFNVEMLQPASYVGQSVGIYVGAKGSGTNVGSNVWAINSLIRAEAGSAGTYQCIEVDVDCFSDAALVKGISINGVGTANPDVGLELLRTDTTLWKSGIDILNAIRGIRIRNTANMVQGITIFEPNSMPNVGIAMKQFSDGGDCIVMQRFTDTASTGYAFRLVNAANSISISTLSSQGNFNTSGIIQTSAFMSTPAMVISGGASVQAAGVICLGNTVTNSATAGAQTLPANPAQFLSLFIGSTVYKIPLYLN